MEHSAVDELLNVPERRVLRALRQRRPFRSRQLPFEAVQQSIDHQTLTTFGHLAQPLPIPGLGDYAGQRSLCTLDRTGEAAEKPLDPERDIHRVPLRPLEDTV